VNTLPARSIFRPIGSVSPQSVRASEVEMIVEVAASRRLRPSNVRPRNNGICIVAK
jgi:hypothetical protein